MNSKLTGEGDEEDEESVQKKALQFSAINSIEHRDENKTCSACRNDQYKH